MPWAGSRLSEGGIYFVGIATDKDYWADDPQTFEQRLQRTEWVCNSKVGDWLHSPFWQFLDGLTWALLGDSYVKTVDRWGWSNLFKIGWSSIRDPQQWPPPLKDKQRDICVTALREEFKQLHETLIVIVSAGRLDVLDSPDLFPTFVPQWQEEYEDNWNKDNHETTGVWWLKDPNSRNLYVHGYHPRAAVQQRFWGSALGRTIHLARSLLPRFA